MYIFYLTLHLYIYWHIVGKTLLRNISFRQVYRWRRNYSHAVNFYTYTLISARRDARGLFSNNVRFHLRSAQSGITLSWYTFFDVA